MGAWFGIQLDKIGSMNRKKAPEDVSGAFFHS